VVPNPAYRTVQIGFDLARAETVDLAVLDVTGRVVGRVPSQAWEAGRWHAGWDGRGEDGRRVPAGVYWVEMSAGRQVGRSKFTLLR
jgi:flagellar hook assembly protein FlgD